MSEELQSIMDEMLEEICDVIDRRTSFQIGNDTEVLDKVAELVDMIQDKFADIYEEEEGESDTELYGDMDEFPEED